MYCIGTPTETAPVLVTANYKLSFDELRRNLQGLHVWILVIDTRGINVWCAAGKGTFSSEEIGLQAARAHLDQIVSHRQLILPQCSAAGVASHDLRKKSGFEGVFGPIRAEDLPAYLQHGNQADERMRTVTFSLGERLILTPVELVLCWKAALMTITVAFVVSGISPEAFSVQAMWERGLTAAGATFSALLAGTVAVPLLLPWIPGRQFWFKGALAGFTFGLAHLLLFMPEARVIEQTGIILWITAVSSYLAMNFTGATPFTSLSGVQKEMRRGVPFQCIAAASALVLWVSAPFFQ